MLRHLAAAIMAVVLASACVSQTPTTPTVSPQRSPAPLPQPTTGAGPAVISGNPIVVGSSIHGTIEAGDPVCFPNWDASGHCRQFDLTASSDGMLRASLTWEGPSRGVFDPELFVISPDGTWVYSEDPWPERHLIFQGRGGEIYRIVVIGYQPPRAFEVLVEVQ